MDFATCDLCDANEEKLIDGSLAILPPVFSAFGKRSHFSGPARTLKVFEDNVLVRAALETPGEGSVLVVDGGGSLRCALVGGNLGVLAQNNGWAGIIVTLDYYRGGTELTDDATSIPIKTSRGPEAPVGPDNYAIKCSVAIKLLRSDMEQGKIKPQFVGSPSVNIQFTPNF